MSNMLMMRYAATRGGEDNNRSERMDTYGRGMNMGFNANPLMPMHQPVHDEYDGGAESRYRGRDGRWRAGTRRSEYSGMTGDWPDDRRHEPMENNYDRRRAGGDDDDEEEGRKYKIEVMPKNVVEWPYTPVGPGTRANRQIGFGAQNNMEHGDMKHEDDYHMGRSESHMDGMEFDRETAEHWVRSMRNEDKAHPVGGKWTAEMLKPLAQKYGIPTDGKKFWELYAMTNAMYSDYGEVARKFGITSPEFYVCMAKAWMEDKDAEPDKTALYYEYIVKK